MVFTADNDSVGSVRLPSVWDGIRAGREFAFSIEHGNIPAQQIPLSTVQNPCSMEFHSINCYLMTEETTIEAVIREAERILPGGKPSEDGRTDARWQAVIAVGQFIETNPQEVWEFIRRWGVHGCDDIRSAIATCLLEHLLAFDFDTFFPRVKTAVQESPLFADMFCGCSKFDQAEEPVNAKRFDRLQRKCKRVR